jgi:hypothetical protein
MDVSRGLDFEEIMLIDDVVRMATTREERGETYEEVMEPARAARAFLWGAWPTALLAGFALLWLIWHLTLRPMGPPSPPVVFFGMVLGLMAAAGWIVFYRRVRALRARAKYRADFAAAEARPDDYTRKLMAVRSALRDASGDREGAAATEPVGDGPTGPLERPEPPIAYWH